MFTRIIVYIFKTSPRAEPATAHRATEQGKIYQPNAEGSQRQPLKNNQVS